MNEISKNVSMLIDTHAHLHMKHFDNDRTELYDRIRKMKFILNISTSPEDFDEALDVGKALENVYISIGVHPHDALKVSNDFKDYLDKMQSIVKRYRKVIGIGEIGLDYYRNLSPVDVQKKVFAEQLMLANELKLPIVIHIREAHEETYEVLKSIGAEFGGIIHSFSGDELWAKKFVKLGFKLGIGGPLTYPKNDLLRRVVKIIGMENILTETDCPYLPPQVYRGKRNEPTYVYFVMEELAHIFNTEFEDVYWNMLKNLNSVFKGVIKSEEETYLFGADVND